jgi:RNase H-like domain found in reverse transcriptase/Integrase zinc binding domain
VISQDRHPIAFYSRKLTETQRNYTVGEREMLSIVETLNEFRTMLLGYRIKIYMDHANLTRLTTVSKSPRIQRWRWTIEEFGPTIEYINGPRNVVADALSRFDTEVSSTIASSKQIAELYENTDDKSLQDLDYPLSTQIIAEHQRKDQTLIQHQHHHSEYFSKTVDGHDVILFNNKIYIPKALRKPILSWYHTALQHPGIQRTERTMRSHLVWPGLSSDVEKHIRSCHQCQRCKNPRKKYGHLSLKNIDQNPGDTLCVDLIGPYTITTKHGKKLNLHALKRCDPATGWFEVAEIRNKTYEGTAKILDQTWFCRYPRPKRCISDNGNEFLGKEFQELLQSYGVKSVATTVKNPQANFVERVHQTLGNMLRSHELEDRDFDYQDPWSQIFS